jgi:SNF2 family DNA or RNA helicase
MLSELTPLWSDFQFMEHQRIGVRWMLDKEREGTGGLLCDDMGLGKTIQLAGLIKNQPQSPQQKTLVVAPVAVLEQWKAVFKRAAVSISVPKKGAYIWQQECRSKDPLAHAVYVIGYEAAQRSPSLLKGIKWNRVIYDEAHRLASNNSSTELALTFKLRVKNIWLLTGTPIVNKVRDITTLFNVAGIKAPATSDLELLAPLIKNYIMARSMDQLRDQISAAPPRPEFETLHLDFTTDEEREFYNGMTGIICKRWKALDADSGGPTGLARLRLFMRLRQLSLHPQVYIAARKAALKNLYTRADWTSSSTKFDKLREIVCESTTSHKWILFCHFRQEMDMLQEMFRNENSVEIVQQYNGGMSPAEKADVIARSHLPIADGKQEILLIQLQSGGTGINLQHFDRIIFTGPWWTKALMEQAVGRAVRIGQKNVVKVFNLALKEEEALNIDKYMLEKAIEKGELCREVLSNANSTITEEVPEEENDISL